MPNSAGKGGKRKSPLEGFNNVPKILEEARRMVDAVTGPEGPDTSTGAEPAEATVRPSSPGKPKKSTAKKVSTPAASQAKAAPPKKTGEKPAAKAPTARPAGGKKPPAVTPAPAVAVEPEKFGLRIIHRVPGRTRVKLRQMKHNAAFAKKLEERLIIVPGINAVEASTVTARAVVYYNPGIVCQPSAFKDLQDAWQELFPGLRTDQFVAALTCQKLP
jgi:Heavy metal associated domain 2